VSILFTDLEEMGSPVLEGKGGWKQRGSVLGERPQLPVGGGSEQRSPNCGRPAPPQLTEGGMELRRCLHRIESVK
jgi:hypothetical protein